MLHKSLALRTVIKQSCVVTDSVTVMKLCITLAMWTYILAVWQEWLNAPNLREEAMLWSVY